MLPHLRSTRSDAAPATARSNPRTLALLLALSTLSLPFVPRLYAQAPAAAAPASNSQRGTVQSISGSALTLKTDTGTVVSVTVVANARILQIAPGSTDLKTAQPIALTDIETGDRILVSGKAADTAAPGTLTAVRVVLMKSTDIAQQKAKQQADWQRRGSGGIVGAVDASTGTLTVANGAKKTQVMTSSTTIFRRYAGDSVRFEDAQAGTVSQIQPGDQVRVRGTRSDDGASIQAEEIVSGTFRNLAGTVAAVDPSAGTVTVKDLATKKTVLVKVTANSDFRKLPPEMAARFAARSRPGSPAAGGSGAGSAGAASPGAAPRDTAGSNAAQANTTAPRSGAAGSPDGGPARGPGGSGFPGGAGMGARGGGTPDLSQMIARLPTATLADLKAGDAVMIVASQAQPTAASVTAITLLSGVEPILAATPTGSAAPTLSPFGFGGGAPEMGGGGGGQ